MGDPKKRRKQYNTPKVLWEKSRIEQESELIPAYGLKNKTELWKAGSILKSFSQQAKELIASETPQAILEKRQLLAKAASLGLLPATAQLEDILALDIKKLLDRRLQTLVVKKGLARSMKQARQFITHGHIAVNNKLITVPSYLVLKSEEDSISFLATSQLADAEHPERADKKPVMKPKKESKEEKKAEEPKAEVKKEAKPAEKKEKPAEKKEAPKEKPAKKEEAKPKEEPAKKEEKTETKEEPKEAKE